MSKKKKLSTRNMVEGFIKLYFGKGDIYEDPDLYNELVLRYKNRAEMATDLANIMQEYVPTSPQQPATILEEAAGTGIVTKELASRSYHVVATDLSSRFLEKINAETDINQVTTHQADMNKPLTFPDSSFDGLTTVCANRYISVEGLPVFLNEAYRVLKDGGVFVWPVILSDFLIWKKNAGVSQPSRVGTLSSRIQHHGFEIVDIRDEDTEVMHRGKLQPVSTKYIVARKPG